MLKGIKILILEDVLSDVFLIERQLKNGNLNYKLELVRNKNDFIDSFKSNNYNIIISDFHLPDTDGIEILNFVRQSNKNIPFIIVTGALDEETAVKCIKAGADDYLTKENLTRLVSAITSALEKRNIQDEKEKAQKLTEQIANELQSLIQRVNTPIIIVNIKSEIVEWNTAAEQLTGYKKSEVINRSFTDLFFNKENRIKVENIISNTKKGINVFNEEIKINTNEGYKKILFNTSEHRDVEGKLSGIVIIGHDITEIAIYRTMLEDKVEERTSELKKALEKEKELTDMKSRFISMASHEFRTPLSAISFASGFLERYWEKIDKSTVSKKLKKIDSQVYRMIELLDDVLTVGKIQAKKILKHDIVNFYDFIQNISEEVSAATKNTHKIIFNFSDTDIIFKTDKSLLRKIFINLMTNAIKFSPKENSIRLDVSIMNETLICKVTDFGIGIPKDECEHIFTPFHRAKNTESIQGTGLGLPIVKDSVEALGGTVKVKSTSGKETCFTVQLPLTD